MGTYTGPETLPYHPSKCNSGKFVGFTCRRRFVLKQLPADCVSGVCSDLEIQQVVEQFSYMSKNHFPGFLYSWILFLIVYP